jgi:HlyD family secretion protein
MNKKSFIKPLIVMLIVFIFISCKHEINPDAYGNFEDNAITVSAENSGKIIWYNIDDGSVLKKGEKVAVIDTSTLHFKKEALLAAISSVEAKAESVLSQKDVLQEQLDLAVTEQKRINKLFKAKAATKQQKDDIDGQVNILKQKINNVNIQYKSVLAEISKMNVEIKSINNLISKSIVTSPIDGTVLVSIAKESEITGAGRPLFTIQNTQNLILRAYVAETQLSSIKTGQEVTVETDGLKGTVKHKGIITWISNKAEFTPKQVQSKEERKNLVYAIKIKVPNKEGKLKIGMPADVYFY